MSETRIQQQDHGRSPWNKGRLVGQKRPLKPKEVWNIRARLQIEARKRDLAMFNFVIGSKLRGCDLVGLKIDDLCVGGGLRRRATIIQKKTGRPVQFEITEQTRTAVEDWLAILKIREGRFLFPSRVHEKPHISTPQYARIVHGWVRIAGLDDSAYGTHSMRRTKAAQIYKKTGNLRAVQLLLGQAKSESAVRYLGIEARRRNSTARAVFTARKNLTPPSVRHTRYIQNLDQNRISMPAFKGASFQDRQKSTAEAKKALLEKFKARPPADDPVVIEREAQRREIAAAREARAAERDARLRAEADERARQTAEKHAALQVRLKADEEAREADSIVEAARLQLEAEAAIEAKALLEIEKRAQRDARYAARKGRKAESKSEKRRYR